MRFVSGVWIDLDQDCWEIRAEGVHWGILKRSRLRADIAPLAWPILREELAAGTLSLGTIYHHYRAFVNLARVLGKGIPDVCHTSLERIQRAWIQYSDSYANRRHARYALQRLFEARLVQVKEDDQAEWSELIRIIGWLRDSVSIHLNEPDAAFLSEEELNCVLTACFADIQAGQAYCTRHDLLNEPSHEHLLSDEGVRLVVSWAVALMILLMSYTGLRRQSVVSIKTGDWRELRPGLMELLWRHGKKGEQGIVLLPPRITNFLHQYEDATAPLRTLLQTDRLFLNGTAQGFWGPMGLSIFYLRLRQFAARHHIERDSGPLNLGSTLFRRTYSTRALYEGQSIEAISSQLGHSSILTTLLYVKVDLVEHPSQVRDALDIYGRHALTFWKTPVLLDSLPAAERKRLLQERTKHDQDVGLCQEDRCIYLDRGGPPPCSLCEHLATGKVFLLAWYHELQARECELEKLKMMPDAGMFYAQLKGQLDQFKRNLAMIETSREE